MDIQEVLKALQEKFPLDIISVNEFRGQYSVIIKKQNSYSILEYLNKEWSFDYLVDVTCVDYLNKKENRFEVIYQLYSIPNRMELRIRAEVPEHEPEIDSVVPIWAGANWHEREAYDMFGVVFKGHPDLRRILMPEDWEGYPLRKDYPVEGPEEYWDGYKEVLRKAEEYKKFSWKQ